MSRTIYIEIGAGETKLASHKHTRKVLIIRNVGENDVKVSFKEDKAPHGFLLRSLEALYFEYPNVPTESVYVYSENGGEVSILEI